MRRIWVLVFLILGVLSWTIWALAQSSDQLSQRERMEKRWKLREEMHRRMMEKLFQGFGHQDEDLFKDLEKLFEEAMSDSFSGLDSFSRSSNFKSEWQESSSGRTLIITPQTPEQKLDINVQSEVITIKGESEQKSAQGTRLQSFSHSFPVPSDVDASQVKMKENQGRIFIELPFRKSHSVSPKKEERRPVSPSGDEVTI